MSIPISHRFTDDDLPVEAGLYRLIASGSCPWCRCVLIARCLLGLIEAIPVSWSYGRGADGFWEPPNFFVAICVAPPVCILCRLLPNTKISLSFKE